MGLRIKGVLGFVAIAAPLVLVGGFGEAAHAQRATQEDASEIQTIPQAMEDAFFRFDENFFRNRQAPRSITWFTGPFPENEITGDGRVVDELYTQLMYQQALDGPTIRTRDVPSPFTYSVLTGQVVPPEEPIPAAFSSPFSRAPVDSGSTTRTNSRSSVPALW